MGIESRDDFGVALGMTNMLSGGRRNLQGNCVAVICIVSVGLFLYGRR